VGAASAAIFLEPDRIPERVVTDPLDQARPQGIGDDVARRVAQVLIVADEMVS